MYIRVVLLAWVEWIINIKHTIKNVPPQKAGFFLPLFDPMAAFLPIPSPQIFVYMKTVNLLLNAGLGNAFIFLFFGLFLRPDIAHRGFHGALKDQVASMHDDGSKDQSLTFLALGDSYTVGESVPAKKSFPYQTMNILAAAGHSINDPEIVAVTGWSTGDLLKAVSKLDPGKKYDLVSLLIGVNNQYQGRSLEEYGNEFGLLLDKAIHFAGGNPAHVFVLSIPDYSGTPFAASMNKAAIAERIDQFNLINKRLSSDNGTHYIDITPESRKAVQDASLIAVDGLHFSGKEYQIWADVLATAIEAALK